MLEALIFVVFPFCMVFAAVSDMLSMTIANRVSIILVVTFAAVAPLTGMDWATYGWHFAAAGLALSVTFRIVRDWRDGRWRRQADRRQFAVDGLQSQSALLSAHLHHDRRCADAAHSVIPQLAARRLDRQKRVPAPFRRSQGAASLMAWRWGLAGSSPIRTRRWLSGRSSNSPHIDDCHLRAVTADRARPVAERAHIAPSGSSIEAFV